MSEKLKFELSARQIEHIENIRAREAAIKRTLEIAINTHSNHLERINSETEKFWNDIYSVFQIDRGTPLTVTSVNATTCVVETDAKKGANK